MHYVRYYLLTALLLGVNLLQAAIIREDFARMVDYAGWQLVDAYMQDYVRLRPDMKAEKEGFELFQKTYNSSTYSQQKPPNSEAIRLYLISHEWRNAGVNLFADFVNNKAAYQNDWSDQQAAEFLQQKIGAISAEALGAENNADYTSLQATQKRLIQEVAQIFGATGATANQATPPATNNSEPIEEAEADFSEDDTSFLAEAEEDTADTFATEDVDTAEESNVQGFTLPTSEPEETGPGLMSAFDAGMSPILLGAIGVLLLLLLYLFVLYKKLDNRIDKHSKRIEDMTSRIFLKKDPISSDEVQRLRTEIKALQEKVASFKTEPAPMPAPTSTPELATVGEKESRSFLIPDEEEEYYLSTPNSDGTFNASSMSQLFRPSASVYKFKVTESNGKEWAEFTVANDYDAVQDALSSPSSYLDPVCESVNTYFPEAKRIVNVQPGRAMKRGDKWVVKPEHKASIRYE